MLSYIVALVTLTQTAVEHFFGGNIHGDTGIGDVPQAAVVTTGWQGPQNVFYSDADCPNLGCYATHDDWPDFIPQGQAPTVDICQRMCDYCDGPHGCPLGCNAFNGGNGGCCLRQCSAQALMNPTGSEGISYRRIDNPSPSPPSQGRCEGQRPAWGDVSACISNSGGSNFIYHCPWESAGLVSAGRFGGCDGVIYDCVSTNVQALVNLYATHQTPQNPPPEWGIPTMKYAECCVMKQCMNGPTNCGTPPLNTKA